MKRLIKKSTLNDCRKVVCFIGALKKIASEDYEKQSDIMEAISELIDSNNSALMDKLYDDIIKDNPECVYNGTVYRKLSLENDCITDELKEITPAEYNIDEVVAQFKKEIETGYRQSTTYDLQACIDFDTGFFSGYSNVIITFDCKRGLNVTELTKKYLNIAKKYSDIDEKFDFYSTYLDDIVETYEDEKEIYCLIPNNFEIYSINDIVVDEIETILIK